MVSLNDENVNYVLVQADVVDFKVVTVNSKTLLSVYFDHFSRGHSLICPTLGPPYNSTTSYPGSFLRFSTWLLGSWFNRVRKHSKRLTCQRDPKLWVVKNYFRQRT